ncbi:hypothetical protein AB2B38_006900 [Balneola sp. MJW-20]|uniref:DUF7282 domain-containing protein n=1 Tax=Gracilimonas aurantiaca TaxID=3234185 RepID=UPI003465155F
MKSLSKLFILGVSLIFLSTACDENSTGSEELPVASVNTTDQGTQNGNQVLIPEVNSPEDGWVVIHRSNTANDGPQVPEIIGKAAVSAGNNSNVFLQLDESVSDGEILWAMLHEDTGTKGEYEFDGQNGLDNPVFRNEMIVMNSFEIMQTNPSVSAEDQVNQGNIFTVDVNAAEDGWIVIHGPNANNDGPQIPEIIGKAPVEAGINTGVEIALNEGETVSAGDMLFPMLHYDTGIIGSYEFDGQNDRDLPVIVDSDIVLTSFTVQQNNSTLAADDQMVMDNGISVDVTSATEGWVVVHRSNATNNGPQVPEIIGKAPISAGMNTDVQITFDEGVTVEDGEQLWPMVHFDTGVQGEYEFDGVGIHDQPVITANGILMTNITVNGGAPSVTVNDQAAENNEMITITEVTTEQRGWIVLHRDNGNDAPVVPDIIGKAQVYLGANGEIDITVAEGETLQTGDKLWAMLHIDDGEEGAYEFDGNSGLDNPVFDSNSNIVMVQFTIQ